jgi:hypothetical protein
MGRSRKPVCGQPYRGFESLPLRCEIRGFFCEIVRVSPPVSDGLDFLSESPEVATGLRESAKQSAKTDAVVPASVPVARNFCEIGEDRSGSVASASVSAQRKLCV